VVIRQTCSWCSGEEDRIRGSSQYFAETTDNLGIQNEQLRYNLENAYDTYLTEKKNIDVTQRVFTSTTNKFDQGVASNLELVNASNDLITAQSSYVQSVLALVNAQVELEKFLNL
jgi:outer membrane protein TolC